MRNRTQRLFQLSSSIIVSTVVGLSGILYLPHAHAEDVETPAKPTSQPATEDTTPTTGPTAPTGADSPSYTYNEQTGKWESEHYIWDPVTNQTSPKQPQTYSYNPSTGRWDTTEWVYDAPSGQYIPSNSTNTAPAADITSDASPEATTTSSPTPAGSNTSSSSQGTYDLYYNTSISNTVSSTAQSGNVLVGHNSQVGSATSGDALAQATVINLLQSAWNPYGGNFTTFSADINCDVTGDLLIDPDQLPTNNLAVQKPATNLDLSVAGDTELTNMIDLSAMSGNASVDSNTVAGDAVTGNAVTLANVFNLINSAISSGDSFLGTININGNLDGDILFPPGFLEQLLASNAESGETNMQYHDTTITSSDTTFITNNITTSATSGTATLDSNTSAGGAISGNTDTNVTILNLTGRRVIGDNALLVFVNVFGRWVGMIMDTQNGTTSAMIGGNTTSSTDTSENISADTSLSITNDIQLAAQSGNASVTNNTQAGNAISGDAYAAANITNMTNSQLSLSKWLGILYINIFGSWDGSFGINTSAGSTPVVSPSTPTPSGQVQVFRISSGTQSPDQTSSQPMRRYDAAQLPTQTPNTQQTTAVLSASDNQEPPAASPTNGYSWARVIRLTLIAISMLTVGYLLLSAVSFLFSKRRLA